MPNTVLGDLSKLVINGNEMNIKDATLTETVEEIIYAIQQNNQDISDRINDLNDRSFDNIIKISSNNESEISAINDGLYKIQYVTVTGEGEQQTETLNNSAILIQQGTHQYLYKDGKLSNREKTNDTWGNWIIFEGGVTSVNGQTGAVTLSIPTKTSDITNDSGFITDAGVTSFNGQTGAVTYTAPVTSVDGKTGIVTIEHPVTSVNGQTGAVTIDTGVTSFNGQTGAVTYTAPVTSVDGKTGTVTIEHPVISVNGQTGAVTIDTGVTSFNGQTGAVTYTAPVTSVNGQTGAVTIDLTGKADKSAAIGSLRLSINSTDYKVTLSGTKVDGTAFTCEDVIDLPLETMVVSGAYDDTTQKIVLTLKNGTTTDFPVSALIDGLQSEITSTNKLSADLISDGNTNKVVTQAEKDTWNNKVTSVNGQTGVVTIDTGVTSFNGQTGVVTYTAPVTSVNGQTGAVTIDIGVTSFNGQTGAVTYTAPVTSVNGQTGVVVTELSSEYAPSTAVNDELELAAGDTYEEAFGKIEKALNDHATITATALNTLAQNSQLNTIESISVNGVPVSIDSSKNVDITISNDNDEVIAESLIDLNDRLEVVEGNPVGDENIIEAVKVNGTALVPDTNKAVDISVPVKIIEASAYLRGDINEDGIVDTSHDGTILIDILTGHEEATTKSDINLDGTTDMTDYDPALTDIVLSRDTIGKNILFDTNPYNDIVSAESNSLIPILHITITGRDFSLYVPITKNGTNYTGLCQVFNANRLTYFVINSTEAYGEYGVLPSETDWNNKQDKLVSGTNIKTVNNQSLLGSGNISVGVTSFNGSTGAVTYTAPVTSVNGQTGAVNLIIPDAVTESTVSGWGFTKNTGTYSKPSTGIPASDLADGVIPDVPVQSVNGMTGAVTINVGVTSFNGSTGAVTYTAPVTSVNGQTGAVNLTIPDAVTESTVSGWGFTKNTGTLTTETQLSKGTATGTGNAVTDINVSNHQITLVKGATYATQEDINESISNLVNSAPTTLDTLNELATALGNDPNFATTVATQIGEKYTKPSGGIPASDLAAGVIPTVPVQSVNGQTGAVNINVGVTSFNGSTGAVTYTAPVTSVNGQTGAVTVKANVQSDWNATTGDAVILNKPTIPTVNDSTVTITMNGNTVGTFTLNKSGNTTIDLGNVLTSHQSIKTINNQTITGTGNISLNTLPTVSASDNGKVLMVVNGAWQLVSPVTLYSGSGTPANSQGNNGDLYVQS